MAKVAVKQTWLKVREEILNEVLSKLDGKGGGKADMAQGAGSNVSDAKKVIAGVDSLIR